MKPMKEKDRPATGMPPFAGKGGLPPMMDNGASPKFGGPPPAGFEPPHADLSGVKRRFDDLAYGASKAQMLDIFLPEQGEGPFPCLLYMHGGGFAMGDRHDAHLNALLHALELGWALIPIEYRLSGEAIFPAAVLDCREAVRFLRRSAAKYHLDPARFAVMGGSAGGNLSALLAMNIPNGAFLGENAEQGYAESPEVCAAVDWFGPTDFQRMDAQAKENRISFVDHFQPYSAESTYMGVPLMEADALFAAKSNPISYISGHMAPLLIEHGACDRLVPFQQSAALGRAIAEKLGAGRANLVILEGADHEDPAFESPENLALVWSFLKKHL